MKRRKQVKRDLVLMVSAFVAVIMIAVGLVNLADTIKDNELMSNSPLNNYTFYYSLDNFPKYKLEAVEMVEELMKEGVVEQEACQMAIQTTSDKIYEDIREFYSTQENDWDNTDNSEEELKKFIAKRQR